MWVFGELDITGEIGGSLIGWPPFSPRKRRLTVIKDREEERHVTPPAVAAAAG